MGIFDIFRKKQQIKTENMDYVKHIQEELNQIEYNTFNKEESTNNLYTPLIKNFNFSYLMSSKLNIDLNNKEDFEKIPKSFLDKCLTDNVFFNFLVENMFKIKTELLNKIINETITFDDLTYDDMFLIDILSPSDRISTLINRDLSLNNTTDRYVVIKGNEQLSSDIQEYPIYINSYFEDVEILKEKKQYVECTDVFDDEDIKIINKSSNNLCEKGYLIDDNSVLNDDSIILLTFDKYKELSKNPELLEILKKHKFYISDNYNEKSILCNLEQEYFYGVNNDYKNNDLIKNNHIIKVIKESSLSEIEKKYYLYNINIFSLYKITSEISSKITEEELKKLTDDYNNLSIEEKTKISQEKEYSIELFNYINPDFFELSVENQIDILCHLNENELQVVLNNEKIQNLFEEDIKKHQDLYKLKELLNRINNISQNQCVKEFVDRQGLDIKTILQTKEYELKDEYQLNPILAKYFITDSTEKNDLSMEDIVGFSKFHISKDSNNIIDNFSNFFNASGDGYHTRSLSMLDFKDGSEALEKLSTSFNQEPLKLEEYDGKYIISGNGLHRTIVLKFLYTKELLEGKLSKEELNQKYKISNCYITKANYEKSYLNYLLQFLDSSVSGVYNCRIEKNGIFYNSDEPKLVVYYSEKDKKDMSLDEIRKKIIILLSNTNNMYTLNELKENYNKYESFKIFMDNNFHDYINIFNESEEINYEKNI